VLVKHKDSFKKRFKELKALKNRRVVVGFPKGFNAYSNGTPVALVATVHEFGSQSQNIPPRPYFRPTLLNNNFYKHLRKMKFTKVMRGKLNATVALNQIGGMVADDIRMSIVSVSSPTLKPQTIKAKGSSNPLVDTGHLKQSVTHKVEK